MKGFNSLNACLNVTPLIYSLLWIYSLNRHVYKEFQLGFSACSVGGALAFLVSTLDVNNPNKDVEIKANSGGVLRNLCPVIVSSLEYRYIKP